MKHLSPARLAVVAALVGVTVVAGVSLRPTFRDLLAARRADAKAPAPALATAGAPVPPVFVAFTEWIRRTVPAGDRYWVAPPAIHPGDPYFQWLSFRLAPAEPTAAPNRADVAIVATARRAAAPPGFGRLRTFAPGLGVAFRQR